MADHQPSIAEGSQRTPTLGDDDAFVQATLEALVRVLVRTADTRRSQGRFADAERLYRRALKTAERLFGPQHPVVDAIRTCLARTTAHKESVERSTRCRS